MQRRIFKGLCVMAGATAWAIGGPPASAAGSAWEYSSSDANVSVYYRTHNPIYQGAVGDELHFRLVNNNDEPVDVRFQATYAYTNAMGAKSSHYEQSICVSAGGEREAGASPYDAVGHNYSDVDTTIISVRTHHGPCY
jgi:hypothetical protein